LLVPEQRVLRKVIALPAATEQSLDNVLRFEMDRYTPFTSEQVYFGYRIAARERERIQVELLVVQRDYIDPLLAGLAHANLRPSIVTLAEALGGWSGATLNLLPASSRAGQGEWGRNRRVQTAVVLLLLVLVIGWPLYQRQQTLTRLQGELPQLKARAEQSRAVATELQRLESSRAFLQEQQQQAPRLLLLLDELTALLPDHTWLARFEDNGSSFRLDGESAEVSALISLLEQSPLLENVRFASPVTSNPHTEKDRFSLVADNSMAEQAP
jgi:general secretion pathway protein L